MLQLGLFLPVMEGWLGDRWLPRWPEVARLAELAEAVGFDALFVPDHLVIGESPYWGIPAGETRGTWEAWTVVGALAARTRRVAIGTFVLGAGFRNPALLAKMAATADEVSEGRLILGLGCGSHPPEYAAFGYPYDHRVDRFEEALQIIVPLLREGRVDFAGRYHEARACELLPRGPPAGGAAHLDRRLPAADDAPDCPVGRCLRHRVASGCAGGRRAVSDGSTPRVPMSAGRPRRSAVWSASSSGPGRSRAPRCRWARSAARRKRSRRGSSVSTRPASATWCACWIPATPAASRPSRR